MNAQRFLILAIPLALLAVAATVNAQIAVWANDNKVVNVNGKTTVVPNPQPDTVTIIDLKASPPRVIAEVQAPVSVVGPPLSVAITPDGKTALVTRDADNQISVLSIDGTKVEHTKRNMIAGVRPIALDIVPNGAFAVVGNFGGQVTGDNDTISLIDLKAKPPRVVDTITVGQSPEGVKVSPDGSVIAVVLQNGSNRPKESPFYNEGGKLVLFRVTGASLSKVTEARIGHWPQAPPSRPTAGRSSSAT